MYFIIGWIVAACVGIGVFVIPWLLQTISNHKWRKLYDSPEYQRRRREGARMYAESQRIIMRCQYCGTPKKHVVETDAMELWGTLQHCSLGDLPVEWCHTCGAPYYPGSPMEPTGRALYGAPEHWYNKYDPDWMLVL